MRYKKIATDEERYKSCDVLLQDSTPISLFLKNDCDSIKMNISLKQATINNDRFSIFPIVILGFFFCGSLWIYSNYTDLIFFIGVACALLIGLYGIFVLFFSRWRKSISYIIPAILFLMLSLPSFIHFREILINTKHWVHFLFEENNYSLEVEQLKKNGIQYKEWKWGALNANEYKLIYDETDHVALTESQPTLTNSCSRSILKLKSHFYVADDFCP
ncbi:hypothetical protein [Collimonas sp.]|uniref:hypothetical protein n=1 Tax=Collimonas sp. TaxID=1963772 RepID=UPI002C01F9E8|nr:hypothetical protein [Collimonas sp.]HWW04219.1 hypothetical protein [Collimonas sp.]